MNVPLTPPPCPQCELSLWKLCWVSEWCHISHEKGSFDQLFPPTMSALSFSLSYFSNNVLKSWTPSWWTLCVPLQGEVYTYLLVAEHVFQAGNLFHFFSLWERSSNMPSAHPISKEYGCFIDWLYGRLTKISHIWEQVIKFLQSAHSSLFLLPSLGWVGLPKVLMIGTH